MFNQSNILGFISSGNETLDKFLGKGFLRSSLNLFERQGPSSRLLDSVWNKTVASSTLSKGNLIYINFNTAINVVSSQLLDSLPVPRKVKSELLYKDIRGTNTAAQIKIAWRYSSRSLSPAESMLKTDQIDFGLSLVKEAEEDLSKKLRIINLDGELKLQSLLASIQEAIASFDDKKALVNIICKDLLHPFSPIIENSKLIFKLMYLLRGLARTLDNGMIFLSYDIDLFFEHDIYKQRIYNIADCVVSFFSFETGQNIQTGYKDIDGIMDYVKVPKLNSFGFHFQRELSDWGYRLTKNHRYLVVDELSLPPCDDDEAAVKKQQASQPDNLKVSLAKDFDPQEGFTNVAKTLMAKQL